MHVGEKMDRYFKHVARRLPNPHGDLAKLMPTTSIKQANKARRGCYVQGNVRILESNYGVWCMQEMKIENPFSYLNRNLTK